MRPPDRVTAEELGRAFGAAVGVLLAVYVLAALGSGLGWLARATAASWGL